MGPPGRERKVSLTKANVHDDCAGVLSIRATSLQKSIRSRYMQIVIALLLAPSPYEMAPHVRGSMVRVLLTAGWPAVDSKLKSPPRLLFIQRALFDFFTQVSRFKGFIVGGGGLLEARHAPLDCPDFVEGLGADVPVAIFGVGAR